MVSYSPEEYARWVREQEQKRTKGNVPAAPAAPTPLAIATVKKSTDEEKLNKTERAYLAYLRVQDFAWIGVQNVTLKLAHDTRFTVDFITISHSGAIVARETKGWMRDDAHVKLKTAARMFPWIEFQLVRKNKNGWDHQTVKP